MLLRDKTALITGSATGIGEGISRYFAEQGARLYLFDRDGDKNESVASSLREMGTVAKAFTGDVRASHVAKQWVDSVAQDSGQIDILVNNAGIYPRQPFLTMNEGQWDEMHDINLKSMFHTCQAVLPHMISRSYGKIINIASVTFHLGMANLAHYIASKGGVIGLTRALAREMGEHGIHINCITPGAVMVEAEKAVVTPEQIEQMLDQQSIRRRIVPLDIARVCTFLASELSDGMTGQILNVDGGWVMY